MATPAEVVGLLTRARAASGAVDRGRAAATAFQGMLALTADQRREVAVLVAERAAPQLVPRIRAQTGLDLTRAQMQAVLDMVRGLDDDDVADLATVVSDPETRSRGLAAAATAAATAAGVSLPDPSRRSDLPPPRDDGAAPEAAGADRDEPTPPLPPAPPGPPASPPEADELAPGVAPAPPGSPAGALETDDPAPAAAPAPPGSPTGALETDAAGGASGPAADDELHAELAATQAELDALESRAVTVTPSWEPDPGPSPPPEPPDPIFDTLDPVRDTQPSTGAPAHRSAHPGHGDPPSGRPRADAQVAVAVARTRLVERLGAQVGAAARLRLLDTEIGQVSSLDPAKRLAVVRAVPDGWARRRAIERLVAASALPVDEVPTVVATLASEVARAWVCATAIEAGLLDVTGRALEDLVGPRAVARLRRRYAPIRIDADRGT